MKFAGKSWDGNALHCSCSHGFESLGARTNPLQACPPPMLLLPQSSKPCSPSEFLPTGRTSFRYQWSYRGRSWDIDLRQLPAFRTFRLLCLEDAVLCGLQVQDIWAVKLKIASPTTDSVPPSSLSTLMPAPAVMRASW